MQCKDFKGIDYHKGFSGCKDRGLCSYRPDWCARFLNQNDRQLMAIDKDGFVVEYEQEYPGHQGHQEHQKHQEHQEHKL